MVKKLLKSWTYKYKAFWDTLKNVKSVKGQLLFVIAIS